jgi:hypothetical protein
MKVWYRIWSWLGLGVSLLAATAEDGWFGIRVVDETTGRGIPLVELRTVNHLVFVTDSAGWVALNEPGWMGQSVFFHIQSHGYEHPKDGFGYRGVAVRIMRGGKVEIRLKRINLAERLYRVTGEGIYRDSFLLGIETPINEPLGPAYVAGQDSVFGVPYKGRIHWFWGDTSKLAYPLGHFWMAGAVSDLPGKGGLDPAHGINLRYFTDAHGFSRPVCRLGVETGMIWSDGFLTVPDADGIERLVCHYAHMESLQKVLGHGMAIYNDDLNEFERVRTFDMASFHLFPAQAHVIRHREGDIDYFMSGSVFPNVRVPATLEAVLDPEAYEAWTCFENEAGDGEEKVMRDDDGKLRFEWRRGAKPVGPRECQRLVRSGLIQSEEAPFLPLDVESKEPVVMHRGSVRWNEHRERWVMIAGQQGGTSHLGEIWYSEADHPTGPWRRARKIVTHEKYDFYNPVHHAYLDVGGGRWIHFEGTYVNTFSGNPVATPRYDYNQIMYRLDLDEPKLAGVR